MTDSIWNTYVEESFYGSFAYKQGSQVEAGADDKGDNAALGLLDGEHVSTEEILDAKGQEDPRKPSGGKTSSDNRDLTGGFTFGGGNCHAISRINEIMEDYINIPLKAVAVLLLVGLTIVDFVKNIGDKEADPKKPINKLIKRSIACAILFFAKEIVEVIIKLAGTTGAC